MGLSTVSHLRRVGEASEVSRLQPADARSEAAVTFVVLGPPATKGSTVSFVGEGGRIITKADCRDLGSWTKAVGWSARMAGVRLTSSGSAVTVRAVFQFVRPSKKARRQPTVRPDVDKLARALLDALTGVAYHDDAQIVQLEATKCYGADVRTTVTIEEM